MTALKPIQYFKSNKVINRLVEKGIKFPLKFGEGDKGQNILRGVGKIPDEGTKQAKRPEFFSW